MVRDKAWLQAQLQRHRLVELLQTAQARQHGCSILDTVTSSHRLGGGLRMLGRTNPGSQGALPLGPGCPLQVWRADEALGIRRSLRVAAAP